MKADMEQGDVVAIIGRDGPEGITKIARVRMRLGKVTGYDTTDRRKWTRYGTETGGLPTRHIEPATGEHGDAVRRKRLASDLSGVSRETWAKLDLAVLRATWAAVEAIQKASDG